jgi:hypothetical protein
MREYPEDVMKAANEVVTQWKTGGTSAGLMPLIARAIMAERERAAKTAERLLVFADTTSRADVEIPAAIRRGGSE